MQIRGRLQLRYSNTNDSQPVTIQDYEQVYGDEFGINRARLKIGGHAYQPWLKYYLEYELQQGYLLDYRVMIEKYDALKFKAGQWKFEYSRERSISSGGQQMLDRSIINRVFTIDRQQGAAIYGRLNAGSPLDVNYWLGIGTGTGRGSNQNDDRNALYYGRLQWNVFGEEMGFKASDLKLRDKPLGSIAVAGSTNRSAYTRFSSSGGGQLPFFDGGEDSQYDIEQYLIETAFMYKGFSWQSEYHEKTVTDRLNNNEETDLDGYYVQAGYFFNQMFDWWPAPLEAAFRYASFDESSATESDTSHSEQSLALNWFFNGHNNKVTTDITRFDIEQVGELSSPDRWQFRVQWDVSF
ncbi:porin [Alteromonas aestuariivivens]|uniref:Porin n=2 Tax=Alteromonas aestuariivivens TaxID=1938339 RepID=A0A3D8M466_9ALTE|nr:porin [Alteromonas aestuariivivens]